jgi:superfamily II RNA helicase
LNQKTDIESFYEKSLYGSEVKKNQMFIEKAKINLEKQINSVNINSFLTEDDEEFIRIYNELQEKILLQKGKQYKKTKLEIDKMEKDMSKTLKSYFEKEKELLQKKENLKRLEENLDETNNELKIRLNEIKSINESQGLIKDEKLTSYGKIVAHLTNCSELLLGKLIAEKYFDDKDWKEIGMVLSLLVEEKDKDGEINNQIIQEIQDEYYNIIEFYEENNLKYKINFTKVFVKPFMLWMEKKPLIEILSEYNNFDGNFVKNLYKIRDVCQEIVKICEMFNMMDLLEKINVLIENIIYGIGEFDSLYVNHYELVNKLLKN